MSYIKNKYIRNKYIRKEIWHSETKKVETYTGVFFKTACNDSIGENVAEHRTGKPARVCKRCLKKVKK